MSEETVKTAKPAKKSVESAGFSCYIGPTVLGYVQQGTLYPVDKEQALKLPAVQLATKRFPEVASLIVDGNELSESQKKIKIKGTALYEKARQMLEK